MKKENIYYYDEDDAVPIKRKKKAPSKNNAAPKSESISFTPRKSAPASSSAPKAKAMEEKKAATLTAEKKAAGTTAEVKKAAAVSETKKAETVSAKAVVTEAKRAETVSAKAVVTEAKKAEILEKTPAATVKKEAVRVAAEPSRKTVEVAEIPYNREFGRINHVAPRKEEFTVKEESKKPEAARKRAEKADFPATEKAQPTADTKKKNGFKIPFIIYTAVLLILSLSALLYVRGLLLDYEAAQPENIVQSKIDEMKKAAEKGKISSAVSLDGVMEKFSPTEEDLAKFTEDFLNSEITYKKVSDTSDPDFIAFDILSDKYKMARLEMRSRGKTAKLVIFTMDKWDIEKFEVTGFTLDVTLPASLTVKNGETVIEGVPTEDGKTATYCVSSLTMPSITFTDVLGNTKSYSDSGEYKFKEYIIEIPSNYTLKGNDTIPLSVATLSDIDKYKYVSEYCKEMPKTATYSICIMSDEADLKVFDNKGEEVDVSTLGNSFKIEGQKGYDAIPENVANAPDPLAIAKQWSLFMTDDLGGKTHGFYNMEKYLIANSYLREVAWEWATGVDITFTSPHTLAKNPFTAAEATNFVSYSDTCFSCDILLEKPMYIKKANTVTDKIYSTFYFVYCDDTDDGRDNPHWAIADIQKIAE